MDWLSDNWQTITAVLYLVERLVAVRGDWRSTVLKMTEAIESPQPKQYVRAHPDRKVDVILDTVDPKKQPRVSRGERFAQFVLGIIPILSHFRKGR